MNGETRMLPQIVLLVWVAIWSFVLLWSALKIEALGWVSFWKASKFQPFSWRVGSNPRRRPKNVEMKYNTRIVELVHGLYGTWFQYNVKNQEFNHLTPLLVVTMSYTCWFLWWANLIWRTSSDIFVFNLGLRFERLFWERYILKGHITFEGHWRLQSWNTSCDAPSPGFQLAWWVRCGLCYLFALLVKALCM